MQIFEQGTPIYIQDENEWIRQKMRAYSMYAVLNEQRAPVIETIKERGSAFGDDLEQLMDGRKNVSKGCAELSALRLAGYDFIYQDFDELYSQLQHYPLPEQYHQWNEKVLEEKLIELERLNDQVIALSLELLEEIR